MNIDIIQKEVEKIQDADIKVIKRILKIEKNSNIAKRYLEESQR